MTRQRKEILREIDEVERREAAEYEMSCGFCTDEIHAAFLPLRNILYEKFAATYGQTVLEHDAMVFSRQYDAYKSGRLQWSPMPGCLM